MSSNYHRSCLIWYFHKPTSCCCWHHSNVWTAPLSSEAPTLCPIAVIRVIRETIRTFVIMETNQPVWTLPNFSYALVFTHVFLFQGFGLLVSFFSGLMWQIKTHLWWLRQNEFQLVKKGKKLYVIVKYPFNNFKVDSSYVSQKPQGQHARLENFINSFRGLFTGRKNQQEGI